MESAGRGAGDHFLLVFAARRHPRRAASRPAPERRAFAPAGHRLSGAVCGAAVRASQAPPVQPHRYRPQRSVRSGLDHAQRGRLALLPATAHRPVCQRSGRAAAGVVAAGLAAAAGTASAGRARSAVAGAESGAATAQARHPAPHASGQPGVTGADGVQRLALRRACLDAAAGAAGPGAADFAHRQRLSLRHPAAPAGRRRAPCPQPAAAAAGVGADLVLQLPRGAPPPPGAAVARLARSRAPGRDRRRRTVCGRAARAVARADRGARSTAARLIAARASSGVWWTRGSRAANWRWASASSFFGILAPSPTDSWRRRPRRCALLAQRLYTAPELVGAPGEIPG